MSPDGYAGQAIQLESEIEDLKQAAKENTARWQQKEKEADEEQRLLETRPGRVWCDLVPQVFHRSV